MEGKELLESAFGIKTQEEKIKEVFGDPKSEEETNDDNKEQPTAPLDGEKGKEKEGEKNQPKEEKPAEKGQKKEVDLESFLKKDDLDELLEKQNNKINDLLQSKKEVDKKETIAIVNRLKEQYREAADAGEDEKADEYLEKLALAKMHLKEFEPPKEDSKETDEEKPAPPNSPLVDLMEPAEKDMIASMIYDIYPEIFKEDKNKEIEGKLATIHRNLFAWCKDPEKRIEIMKNEFEKAAKNFELPAKSPNLNPGDTDRGQPDPTVSKTTIEQVPQQYVEHVRKTWELDDEAIVRAYEVDKETNFGTK